MRFRLTIYEGSRLPISHDIILHVLILSSVSLIMEVAILAKNMVRDTDFLAIGCTILDLVRF